MTLGIEPKVSQANSILSTSPNLFFMKVWERKHHWIPSKTLTVGVDSERFEIT